MEKFVLENKKFDLFHVDACHSFEMCSQELFLIRSLATKSPVTLVIDDIDCYPQVLSEEFGVGNFTIPFSTYRNVKIDMHF